MGKAKKTKKASAVAPAVPRAATVGQAPEGGYHCPKCGVKIEPPPSGRAGVYQATYEAHRAMHG